MRVKIRDLVVKWQTWAVASLAAAAAVAVAVASVSTAWPGPEDSTVDPTGRPSVAEAASAEISEGGD